jgi:WD40 repeat protein
MDKTLKVWDLESGRELRTLAAHSGWGVSASWDQTV